MDRIDGTTFQRMILHATAAIDAQKQSINDLNVFPVPDGDTGTNMTLTLSSAAAEARKNPIRSIGKAASSNASALLRGARGNSGVILSLLFRGVARGLRDRDEAGAADFARALQDGVDAAYKAVMKPTEGTILTVSRVASAAAAEQAEKSAGMEEMLESAILAGQGALSETIHQNPVLEKAGVVDAGGKGFLVILQGMLDELRGLPMPARAEDARPAQERADFSALSGADITFTFDTVFIVRKDERSRDLAPFRAYLGSIGDSLVIGEDDEAFKVHVHTDTPGAALSEAQKYGVLELAKIENMRTQYEDMAAGRKPQSTDDLDMAEAALESAAERQQSAPAGEKKFGAVAVCAGDGMAALFRDLGADGVVSGGQTMNPATEDILREIERIPAGVVYVLPNNKNIIMAAQQCEKLVEDKRVVVLPTRTVPQGVSAMLSLDPEGEEADNTAAMTEALSHVTTTEITYAARSSTFDGVMIAQGDYMALTDGQLFGVERVLSDLLVRLTMARHIQEAEFVNIYYGQDVPRADAEAARDLFTMACPTAEVTLLAGGQPVYYYLISAE